jgi:hypothetical protein
MSTTRLDDPRYDVVALQLHLAREVAVPVHGKTLAGLIAEVDEALADLAALPDDAALGGDLVGVTSAMMGVQQFLAELKERFDAAVEVRS